MTGQGANSWTNAFARIAARCGLVARRASVVLALLCIVVCTRPALAQLGPDIPSDATSLVQPARTLQTNPGQLNPLEVLDIAGSVLPGSSQAGSSQAGSIPGGTGPARSGLSTAVNILVVLTIVSLAPSIMLMCTSFVRILVVLGLLRQALGTQSIPPPQVLTALAMFMTLMVMTPTLDRINDEAITPYREGQVQSYDELWKRGSQPVRDFMFAQIDATGNWSSVYMLLEYRGVDVSEPARLTRADVDMVTLVPAYMLSELKTAFLMGFRIYLPFLVIDMVISTMLISMSMMMLPPVLISLPFKLLLFVLVDGWALVVGGLLHSFAQPLPVVETAMLLHTMDLQSASGALGAQAHEFALAIVARG
jgi:flagellar biosynthetic protein FliP